MARVDRHALAICLILICHPNVGHKYVCIPGDICNAGECVLVRMKWTLSDSEMSITAQDDAFT